MASPTKRDKSKNKATNNKEDMKSKSVEKNSDNGSNDQNTKETALRNVISSTSSNTISASTAASEDDKMNAFTTETTASIEADNTSAELSLEIETEAKADENNSSNNDSSTPLVPPSTFSVFSRMYARDQSGMLYEAIVRKMMYGPLDKKKTIDDDNDNYDENNNNESSLDGHDEEECAWHYFVHFLKWNVKWDMWVPESKLFEDCKETKELAAKMKAFIKKGGKDVSLQLKKLERDFRIEEAKRKHREASLMNERQDSEKMDPKRETKKEKDKTNGTNNESAQKKPKQKISLTKIKKLYKDDLELPRKQSLSDRIQLPFSLKKVMVDEWEIISQTDKVPNLPTTISIKSVLDQYLESKLQLFNSTTTIIIMDKSNEKETKSGGESKNQNTIVDDNPNLRASRKAQKRQEFYDMVEGITTYFDHMLPKHLLYRQEIAQYETIQKKPRFKYLRKCEIYGCEYLLRLFVRLPSLYEQKQQQEEEEEQKNNKLENQTKTINDNELRKVYAMIGDLVRYLQKHQYLFFKQTYRKPKDDEVMPMELHEVQVSTLDNDENRRTKKLKTTHSNNSNNKSKVSDRREKLTSTKDRKSAVRRKSKSVKHKVTGRNTTITKTNK